MRFRASNTTTGLSEEDERNGIGNTSVAFKYQFAKSPKLAAQVSVFAPSGYEPTVSTDATKVNMDLAWSGHSSLADLHLQVGYGYVGKDREHRNLSDAAVANLAIARYFGSAFVASLELNLLRTGGILDPKLDSPPQAALDLTPGFKIGVKDNLNIGAAARISLTNDIAFGYDTSYLFLAAYTF